MLKKALRLAALVPLAVAAALSTAQAQTFPSKPITLVVPWPPGGGSDVIAEADSTSGNEDLLQFDSELTPLDLVLSQQANDLRIAIHGTADEILLENWFLGEDYQVETIEAGTGGTLLNAQVDQLIQAMASFSQQSGLTWDQAIDQRPQDVQTVLAASWQ
mgnify:CR=1 FL=1